jgi:hypothetical protein
MITIEADAPWVNGDWENPFEDLEDRETPDEEVQSFLESAEDYFRHG